jgi:tRNA pseudouridine55 synthase
LKTAEDFQNGQILLIDKPLKWSSFQAVNKLKYALINNLGLPKNSKLDMREPRPISHRIIISMHKIHKENYRLQGQAKNTQALFFGATTASYDLETEVDQTYPTAHRLIQETVKQFWVK